MKTLKKKNIFDSYSRCPCLHISWCNWRYCRIIVNLSVSFDFWNFSFFFFSGGYGLQRFGCGCIGWGWSLLAKVLSVLFFPVSNFYFTFYYFLLLFFLIFQILIFQIFFVACLMVNYFYLIAIGDRNYGIFSCF